MGKTPKFMQLAAICATSMLFIANPNTSNALTLIDDIDTADLWTMYGDAWDQTDPLDENDTNPDYLYNVGDDSVLSWIQALTADNTITSILKYDDDNPVDSSNLVQPLSLSSFIDFYPGFEWDYAVVKTGAGNGGDDDRVNLWAFSSDGDAALSFDRAYWADLKNLTYLPEYDPDTKSYDFTTGVSGITFFNGGAPVPEPATMLLFGTGLAGLAGLSRRKKK